MSNFLDTLHRLPPARDAFQILLDAGFKSVAVLALAGVAVACMKRRSAAARHLVCFLAVACLPVLPLLSWSLPGWRVLPQWLDLREPPRATTSSTPSTPSITSAPSTIPPTPHQTAPVAPARPEFLSPPAQLPSPALQVVIAPKPPPVRAKWDPWRAGLLAWLAGALLALTPPVLGVLSLHRLERASRRETAPSWLDLLAQLLTRLRFHRRVVLLSAAQRRMPMTWGVLRPRILLPEESRQWPQEHRSVVLLHELAHAQRCDYLTLLITRLVCALYWFNPLIWLAARRMIAERERACDDIVLRHGAKPADYAEQVLEISAGLSTGWLAGYGGVAMARPSNMESRLRAILDPKRDRAAVSRAAMLSALVLAVFVVIPVSMMRAAAPGVPANPATTGGANSNTLSADVDHLLKPGFKEDLEPVIQRIVACGDVAVPLLTNRLADGGILESVKYALVRCLCRIGTDESLKVVREIIQGSSARREVVTAIQEYPTNREAELVEPLIRLEDPASDPLATFWATERLREMIRRKPAVAGVIIASLDDDAKREGFSWNLGDILAEESGHANRWGVFGPSDPKTLVAQRNSIWRAWWERNKDKSIEEWKAEALVVSATIPMHITPPSPANSKPSLPSQNPQSDASPAQIAKSPETVLAEIRKILPEDWTCELNLKPGELNAFRGLVTNPVFDLDFTNSSIWITEGAGSYTLPRPVHPHPWLRLYFLPLSEKARFQRRKGVEIWNMFVIPVAETPDYFVVTTTTFINSGRTSTVMERATAPMGRALEKYFGKFADEQTGDVLGMEALASDGLTTGIGVTGQVVDDQTGKPVKEFTVEWWVADPKQTAPWWVLQPDGWWVVPPHDSDAYFGGRLGLQFEKRDDSMLRGQNRPTPGTGLTNGSRDSPQVGDWDKVEYFQSGRSSSRSGILWEEGQRVWPKIRADGYLTEPITLEPVVWPVKLTNLVIRLKRAAGSAPPAVQPGGTNR